MQINFLIECILKLNERIFVSPHNNFYFFAKILRFQWFNRSERTKNKTFFKIFTFKKTIFFFRNINYCGLSLFSAKTAIIYDRNN